MVFQFVRERSRGRVERDDNVAERVLRAIAAGIVINAVYLIVAGPWLTDLVGAGRLSLAQAVSARPRVIALTALVLVLVVPAAAAWTVNRVQRARPRWSIQYRATGTAWAHVFARQGPCFIRIRLDDGTWVGGWYGNRSLASSLPSEGEIYLESSYRMTPQGRFLDRVVGTGGVIVRADAVEVLEIVHAKPSPTPPSASPPEPIMVAKEVPDA